MAAGGAQALDSAAAIALMDGDTELYQEIAQAYLLEIEGLAQRMEALLQKPPLEEATRTLHTAKGLSATLGATDLAGVCRQCELQLKSLPPDQRVLDPSTRQSMQSALAQSIAATQQALLAVLANMDAQVQQDMAQTSLQVDKAALVVDLRRLRDLLLRSDAQALDWHNTLLDRYRPLQEQLQALHRAVKAFDFVQAVVQCDELIHNFSSTIIR
jgi:HPt (histidine-containing phosphotransfer) domain-containing protein